MSVNPWQDVHAEDDRAYTGDGYTAAMSRALTASEYAGEDQAHTCGNCGSGRAFYRATVGAVMCTACSAVRVIRDGEDGTAVERWI